MLSVPPPARFDSGYVLPSGATRVTTRSPMYVWTMWTSTVLPAGALPAQPEIVIELSTVLRSGMVTSVGLVPEQPGGPFTVNEKVVVCTLDGEVPVSLTA